MSSTQNRKAPKAKKVQVVRVQTSRTSEAGPAPANDARALLAQGNALMQRARPAEAVVHYRRAIELQPELAAAWCNLGSALQAAGRNAEAIGCLERALRIQPGFAEAHFNLGNALKAEGRLDESIGRYAQCIALRPGFAPAHNNRGLALLALDRLEDAEAGFRKAIECDAGYVDAHYNLGIALREQSRLEDAVASYDRALALRPGHASSRWNKALALLQLGRLEEGWPLYESRLRKLPTLYRTLAERPVWTGRESLQGCSLLVRAEQGFGDSLQYSRYVPIVAARGARVVLEAHPSLVRLMHSLEGVERVVKLGDPVPETDFHCPLISLPFALGTRLCTIPARVPYLSTDPAQVQSWADRLGARRRPRVGLAWSGSVNYDNDSGRSIPLAQLLPWLPSGLDYISLQREVRTEDLPALEMRPDIQQFGLDLGDFAQTGALCELLDLVVSVDTSAGHLAGALGRPTWLLLSRPADWRWFLDRTDSPWYPNARLLRQHTRRDWSRALESLCSGLQQLAVHAT